MIDLRSSLAERACIGTFLKLPRAEVVDILALAGFDFLICDMEHAQITEESAGVVLRAAQGAGIPVVVRLPDPEQGIVNRLLEAGAAGIQLPRCQSADGARRLRAMTLFPPEGVRSVGRANTRAAYGAVPLREYVDNSLVRPLVVGQFETKDIEDPADDMIQALDVAFIGPTDLSVDLGTPGDEQNPAIRDYVTAIEETASSNDAVMGAFAGSIDQARGYAATGYRYIAVSGDVSMIAQEARRLRRALEDIGS